MVSDIVRQLLEAGVHFGHQTKRWNPKMAPYIFGQRNGIYIINLEKTSGMLKAACDFVRQVATAGKNVLFVGTKKQAKDVIIEESLRCNMFYVTERWLGGLLTNFVTIRSSVNRMKEIEKMKEDGTMDLLSKKEQAALTKELAKLQKNLQGVASMDKLPGALFIVDSKREETAIKEAKKLNIPIIALVDTNSDPDVIDYPIPGNDDAIRSIKLISSLVANSVLEGAKKGMESKAAEEKVAEESQAKEDIGE
ncbi:MAG: 30S ribosomal protein S2 [Candidatus Omnitrophota bacterium]